MASDSKSHVFWRQVYEKKAQVIIQCFVKEEQKALCKIDPQVDPKEDPKKERKEARKEAHKEESDMIGTLAYTARKNPIIIPADEEKGWPALEVTVRDTVQITPKRCVRTVMVLTPDPRGEHLPM